MIPNNFLCIWN